MNRAKGYAAFSEYAKGKTFSLIGLGVSNLPLVSFLYEAGAASVVVRDLKKKEGDNEVIEAKKAGATVILGEKYLEDLAEDVLIRSPGIRPDIEAFRRAKKSGARITCETELFLQFVPCRSFAVTGSDGKTTTTTLISKILAKSGVRVHLGGNIGKAMLPQLKDTSPDDFAVMELSSFQLMECAFSPDVAVITNLSENHLDWHVDMDEYLVAKQNILLHQSENSIAVLNADNVHTAKCSANGRARYFSCADSTPPQNYVNGIYCLNGWIFLRKNSENIPFIKTADILLPGKHNVENYMAAIAATQDFVSADDVLEIAKSFGGVEHRIELVRELDGVKYYNSSIDSSPTRSTAALKAFNQKVIMIAGGYDKNLDYTCFGDIVCEKVSTLILCGATSEKIKTAVKSSKFYSADTIKIISCSNFDETVKVAKKEAKSGDIVILSPASASFDLFRNFDERGKYFKKLVTEL